MSLISPQLWKHFTDRENTQNTLKSMIETYLQHLCLFFWDKATKELEVLKYWLHFHCWKTESRIKKTIYGSIHRYGMHHHVNVIVMLETFAYKIQKCQINTLCMINSMYCLSQTIGNVVLKIPDFLDFKTF